MTSNPPFTNAEMWSLIDKAEEAAQNSRCDRSKVGAVLVHPKETKEYVAWNAVEDGHGSQSCKQFCPRGTKSYDELPSEAKFEGEGSCTASHAEMQVIGRAKEGYLITQMQADKSTDVALEVGEGFFNGWWMFVTLKPCTGCRAEIDRLGIKVLWTRSRFETKTRKITTPWSGNGS